MVVLTSLFFMWGFMTVMNDVLVPHWKKEFTLTYAESLSVQWCFFGAYFLCSLLLYMLSMRGWDALTRLGYKRTAMFGLLISAAGCAAFVPASYVHSYWAFLGALFVLGCGFTVLQIAANPFVAIIGTPEGASSRLNLAQAFNSLGTTLAPIVGGWLVFDRIGSGTPLAIPYAWYAAVFVLLALLLAVTRLPEPQSAPVTGAAAWRHPQVRYGMLAIFCYVGAEVAIGSLFINFVELPEVLGMEERVAKYYLSLYWGGAMCGRFLGAIALGGNRPVLQRAGALVATGVAVFGVLLLINRLSGGAEHTDPWPLLAFILANAAAFLAAGRSSSTSLGLFACIAAVLCALAMLTTGMPALWALVAIGLFNSVMWSNIFTLAIEGLQAGTGQASSLLVMMIVGGAAIPKVQGIMADSALGLQLSFLAPLVCYAYLAWYGFISSSYSSAAGGSAP